MNKFISFAFALLCTFTLQAQAQQLSPEEKAQQAAVDMHKRLGLKDKQIQQIYGLNLVKIQKARTLKTEKHQYKKLDRQYKSISEEYHQSLRGVLTPEQYQRWELLRNEALERRKVIQSNYLADASGETLIDPETEFEHLVTQ